MILSIVRVLSLLKIWHINKIYERFGMNASAAICLLKWEQ